MRREKAGDDPGVAVGNATDPPPFSRAALDNVSSKG